MISQRDVERYLDDWLGTTPMESADRVVVAVAVRISRERQRRQPVLAWARARFAAGRMLPVAAAIVVLVAVIELALFGKLLGPGGPGGSALSTPPRTSAPSPTATTPGTTAPAPTATVSPKVPAVSLRGGLPAGWTVTASGMLTFHAEANGGSISIELLPNRRVMTIDCTFGPAPGIGATADAIIGALVTRPALIPTGDRPASVGGLQGRQVDLLVDPARGPTCPVEAPAYVPLFGSDGTDGWEFAGIAPNERIRLIALDAPERQNVLILVAATDASTFDRFIGDAITIIGNLEFDTGP